MQPSFQNFHHKKGIVIVSTCVITHGTIGVKMTINIRSDKPNQTKTPDRDDGCCPLLLLVKFKFKSNQSPKYANATGSCRFLQVRIACEHCPVVSNCYLCNNSLSSEAIHSLRSIRGLTQLSITSYSAMRAFLEEPKTMTITQQRIWGGGGGVKCIQSRRTTLMKKVVHAYVRE